MINIIKVIFQKLKKAYNNVDLSVEEDFSKTIIKYKHSIQKLMNIKWKINDIFCIILKIYFIFNWYNKKSKKQIISHKYKNNIFEAIYYNKIH